MSRIMGRIILRLHDLPERIRRSRICRVRIGGKGVFALEASEAALDHALGDIEGLIDDLRGDPLQVLDRDHQLGQVTILDAEIVSRVREQGGHALGRECQHGRVRRCAFTIDTCPVACRGGCRWRVRPAGRASLPS